MQSEPMRPTSFTHAHLANVLAAELPSRVEEGRPVRILDMGCGPAVLTAFLARALPERLGVDVELHGVDVQEHAGRFDTYLDGVLDRLRESVPSQDWSDRIRVVTSDQQWPHEAGFFDAVVSNQVLEHVQDPAAAFRNMARCLREDGIAVHLFPTREVLWEDHVKVPLAHRIQSDDNRAAWIRTWSRLRLSSAFRDHQRSRGVGVSEFAEYSADYLRDYTNHLPYADYVQLARTNGLRASLRYTEEMYRTFLRFRLGSDGVADYRWHAGVLPHLVQSALLRVSGISLFLHKRTVKVPSAD